MAEESAPPRAARRLRLNRRLLRFVLLVLIPLALLLVGIEWYARSARYITTENAYLKADMIAVSTNVDGRVVRVSVEENQRVAAREELFRLDPERFALRLRNAEARLVSVRNEIESIRAEYRQVEAELAEAREQVRFYARQAERQRELRNRGTATRVRADEAELDLATSRQRVAALEQKIQSVVARLGGDPFKAVELTAAFEQAEVERDLAALELEYTRVTAPVAGTVSRMRLEPGEWVEQGEAVFSIIETEDIWLEANLKETQLDQLVIGQKAKIVVDAYPDLVWDATVTSISPATGAEFAVLPPQNASGNWVKVVQRLPVRMRIERPPDRPPLRAGMTASVSIDTGRDTGLLQRLGSAPSP